MAGVSATGDRLDPRAVAVIGVMGLAAFMSVLDGTIVTVAVDTFTDTFDASVATIGWVSVGYLLAAAVSLPVSGWAIERFGGRRVFLAGLGLFVLGSVLASTAWSAESLIVFRVIQGLGGGSLEPTALTLAARVAEGRRVGAVMGFISLVINIAPVVGPIIGGLFLEGGDWRWIFLVNAPLGLAIVALSLRLVPDDPGDASAARSDLVGLGFLAPGFALILLAIERIGVRAPLWQCVVPAVVGAALVVGFGVRALRVDRPVVDLRLFTRSGFASSVGVMGLVGYLMYSQLVGLPLFVHARFGRSGVGQGILVTALGVGLFCSMATASRVSDRVGPRRIVGPGAVVTAAGMLTASFVHERASLPALFALFVLIGVGFGAAASPTFSSVYRTVPPDRVSHATTTLFVVVQTTASLGVTVLGLLVSRSGDDAYGVLFPILTGAAVLIAAFSRLLPGPPDTAAPTAAAAPDVVPLDAA